MNNSISNYINDGFLDKATGAEVTFTDKWIFVTCLGRYALH